VADERHPRREIRKAVNDRLEREALSIAAELGRRVPQIDIVSAVVEVGLAHRAEVLDRLRNN
jgi:hypothetical protein